MFSFAGQTVREPWHLECARLLDVWDVLVFALCTYSRVTPRKMSGESS